MRLAFITTASERRTDPVLSAVAAALMAEGARLAGVVQTNTARPGSKHCDMDIQVLPAGPVIRISQDTGDGASGCRLDAGALEAAVAAVESSLVGPVDLLIVNKFGRHEAEGRGFRALVGEALAQGIPVLTAVKHQNREAFDDFSVDLAMPLSSSVSEILAWCRSELAIARAPCSLRGDI